MPEKSLPDQSGELVFKTPDEEYNYYFSRYIEKWCAYVLRKYSGRGSRIAAPTLEKVITELRKWSQWKIKVTDGSEWRFYRTLKQWMDLLLVGRKSVEKLIRILKEERIIKTEVATVRNCNVTHYTFYSRVFVQRIKMWLATVEAEKEELARLERQQKENIRQELAAQEQDILNEMMRDSFSTLQERLSIYLIRARAETNGLTPPSQTSSLGKTGSKMIPQARIPLGEYRDWVDDQGIGPEVANSISYNDLTNSADKEIESNLGEENKTTSPAYVNALSASQPVREVERALQRVPEMATIGPAEQGIPNLSQAPNPPAPPQIIPPVGPPPVTHQVTPPVGPPPLKTSSRPVQPVAVGKPDGLVEIPEGDVQYLDVIRHWNKVAKEGNPIGKRWSIVKINEGNLRYQTKTVREICLRLRWLCDGEFLKKCPKVTFYNVGYPHATLQSEFMDLPAYDAVLKGLINKYRVMFEPDFYPENKDALQDTMLRFLGYTTVKIKGEYKQDTRSWIWEIIHRPGPIPQLYNRDIHEVQVKEYEGALEEIARYIGRNGSMSDRKALVYNLGVMHNSWEKMAKFYRGISHHMANSAPIYKFANLSFDKFLRRYFNWLVEFVTDYPKSHDGREFKVHDGCFNPTFFTFKLFTDYVKKEHKIFFELSAELAQQEAMRYTDELVEFRDKYSYRDILSFEDPVKGMGACAFVTTAQAEGIKKGDYLGWWDFPYLTKKHGHAVYPAEKYKRLLTKEECEAVWAQQRAKVDSNQDLVDNHREMLKGAIKEMEVDRTHKGMTRDEREEKELAERLRGKSVDQFTDEEWDEIEKFPNLYHACQEAMQME